MIETISKFALKILPEPLSAKLKDFFFPDALISLTDYSLEKELLEKAFIRK